MAARGFKETSQFTDTGVHEKFIKLSLGHIHVLHISQIHY